MKNPLRFTTLLFTALAFVFLSETAYSQTETQETTLKDYSKTRAEQMQAAKTRALEYARQNNLPVIMEAENSFAELMYIDSEGQPQYYLTNNANAAKTISTNKVYSGGGYGYNLDGSGLTIHEWDAGAVLATHQEFSGRVVIGDGTTSTHPHATHVAGTMVASGVNSSAKGMAPAASLRSFNWTYDESEMATEAANNALISNHSYGYIRGWYWTGSSWTWYGNSSISTTEDYLFGFYDSQARDWDQIAYNAPYYLITKSAGNDRGDGPTSGAYPQDGPYDCISHAGISKNVMTVGAVNDITSGYSQPSDVVMSSFSSWGPSDDGRIKPDIVTNGVGLYSSLDNHNSAYGSYSGTSMATPSAAGSMLLLQEHYNDLNGQFMLAATLKALVLHTADEAGSNPGPDYQFGWGLMNTLKAVEKISEDQSINVIDELVLNNGSSYQRTVYSDGNEPLVVTIVWTDPAGTPVSASLDPTNPMLVNDLDLNISGNSSTYYPWKLNPASPASAATRSGENNVDNVETVTIDNPVAGAYTINIDHDGSLSGGSQAYSIIISGISSAPPVTPVADFSASPTTINAGGTVSFFDLSSNGPTSWSWTFSGGSPATSTLQNPSVVYSTPGTYDVTLTVSNASGSDTKTINGYITVLPEAPVADFSANTSTITEGGSVTFADLSTGSISSWSWSFAGGTPATSSLQNPTVVYNTPGTYDVSLTVSNAGGSDTKTINGYITVLPDAPVADFSANTSTITEGGSVTFTDLSSGSISSWSWSFAGGTPASSALQNPTVVYNTPGTYDVSLTVSNAGGSDTKTITAYITVLPAPLGADFSANVSTITAGGSVNFSDLSTGSPTSWSWSFAGGTPATSNLQNPTVVYNTPGTYDVSLTVSNANASDTKTMTAYITVLPEAPVADFSATITTITEGGSVTFADLSTGSISSWSWSFAGGTPATSSLQNPTVVYNTPGTYDVSLTVSNAGGSDTKTINGYITVLPEAPVADFSASATTITEGGSINFSDLSTGTISSWSWTFAGGTPAISSLQNPTVVYNTPGTYDVSLTVSNAGGSDTKTIAAYISVLPEPLIADFTASATTITVGGSVDFSDLSTGTPTSWSWNFAGGTPATSALQNPTVVYNTPGTYDVSLSVSNAVDSDIKTVTAYIVVNPVSYCTSHGEATAEWIESITLDGVTYNSGSSGAAGYQDLTTQVFNVDAGNTVNLSLVPGFNPRSKWEYYRIWIDYNMDGDFLDANEEVFAADKKKNSVNGTITFPAGIDITTVMRVSMKRGSAATPCEIFTGGEVEDYTIKISAPVPQPPVADFAASQTSVLVGSSVDFSDLSTESPTTWLWSFPGGTPSTSTLQNPTVTYASVGTYDVTLTVSNAIGSDVKTKTAYINVSATPPPSSYCIPVNVDNTFDYIDNISIGGVSNQSGANSGGYVHFSSPSFSFAPGQTYPVALQPYQPKNRNFWRIWIDLNNDGDFDDADETLLVANNKKGVYNSSISIPSYASGSTRMRITMKSGNSPSSCEDNFEGEVEDYDVAFNTANKYAPMNDYTLSGQVYPNPASNRIHLNLYGAQGDSDIRIFDQNGRMITSMRTDLSNVSIDTEILNPGLYYISVINLEGVLNLPFIKQ